MTRPRDVEPVTDRLFVLQGVRLVVAVALPIITALTGNFDVSLMPLALGYALVIVTAGFVRRRLPTARRAAHVVVGPGRRARARGGGDPHRGLPESAAVPRVPARGRGHAPRVVPHRARARRLVRAAAAPRARRVRCRHHHGRGDGEQSLRAGERVHLPHLRSVRGGVLVGQRTVAPPQPCPTRVAGRVVHRPRALAPCGGRHGDARPALVRSARLHPRRRPREAR